ncbi:hypothetical protein HDU83_008995 [Entophlyctis luteolus]|nr:hypothetical protein HDU83_008995 [Entophlyctis luteolus]
MQVGTVSWIALENRRNVINKVRCLARLAEELQIPILITTQTPSKLGGAIEDLFEVAPAAASLTVVREEETQNCFDDTGFSARAAALGRKRLVFCGVETDVCVFHTARGALERGFEAAWVIADASGTGTAANDAVAHARMRSDGVGVATCSMLVSELFPNYAHERGRRARQIQLGEVVRRAAF